MPLNDPPDAPGARRHTPTAAGPVPGDAVRPRAGCAPGSARPPTPAPSRPPAARLGGPAPRRPRPASPGAVPAQGAGSGSALTPPRPPGAARPGASAARGVTRRALLGAVAGLAALGAGLRAAPLVHAHAQLLRSVPARRGVVPAAPARVRLWFNERIEPAFPRVAVHDERGGRVDLGDVRVGPEDPTELSVGLPPLAPGTYTVRYRVLSVDGHVIEGEFVFTVRPRR